MKLRHRIDHSYVGTYHIFNTARTDTGLLLPHCETGSSAELGDITIYSVAGVEIYREYVK